MCAVTTYHSLARLTSHVVMPLGDILILKVAKDLVSTVMRARREKKDHTLKKKNICEKGVKWEQSGVPKKRCANDKKREAKHAGNDAAQFP